MYYYNDVSDFRRFRGKRISETKLTRLRSYGRGLAAVLRPPPTTGRSAGPPVVRGAWPKTFRRRRARRSRTCRPSARARTRTRRSKGHNRSAGRVPPSTPCTGRPGAGPRSRPWPGR